VELIYWEGGGGSSVELAVARGRLNAFDANKFRLLGPSTTAPGIPAIPSTPRDVYLNGDATVINVMASSPGPGTVPNPDNGNTPASDAMKTVRQWVATLGPGPYSIGATSQIALADPQNNGNLEVPGGHTPFPNNVEIIPNVLDDPLTPGVDESAPFAPAAVDNDQFVSGVFGSMHVAVGGRYTFALRGDDGMQMRIIGQNFIAVGDTETDTNPDVRIARLLDYNYDHDGDPLTPDAVDRVFNADYDSGNTRATATIDLAAGDYDFEAYHYEHGGGGNMAVWFSPGDKINAWDPVTFYVLSTSQQVNAEVPGVPGLNLALVPEPSGFALAALGLLALGGFRRMRRK
jgi:hypothetical protein